MYSKELPLEFQARAEELERSLARLSDQQIALEIMALVATLGDGHSVMFPFGMRKGVLSSIPVQFYYFSDGLFIIDAPEPNRDWIGAEVLEIGGQPVSELKRAIEPYLSHDNPMDFNWFAPTAFVWPDLLRAIGAQVPASSVELRIRKAIFIRDHKAQRTIVCHHRKTDFLRNSKLYKHD